MTQTATRDEHELLDRRRAGDEQAFAHLVDRCHATMLASCSIERGRGYVERWRGTCHEPDVRAHHLPAGLYVEQIRMTIEAVGRIGEEHVPPDVRDGLVAAFRDFKRTV